MTFKTCFILSCILSFSCNSPAGTPGVKPPPLVSGNDNPYLRIDSIPLPAGYKRVTAAEGSFAAYLRSLPLKRDKTVYLFNGQPKLNQQAQFAVLDISVGEKDLQQCADAAMRLRAEYLFAAGDYGSIVFTDNEGKVYRFTAPFTSAGLQQFLQRVFGMCGSASLAKQLHRVDQFEDIQPGDVIIRGGFPGHAVTVMDVAENDKGEKICLLSQSFMPAQNIHILINPLNDELSPWYPMPGSDIIVTPEYTFRKNELKRW
jgi:hypothetical protein